MNFLGMGPGELVIIMVLALIVFGPGKLPEIGQGMGRAIREFRRATSQITDEFTREIQIETRPQEPMRAGTVVLEESRPAEAQADPPTSDTASPSENWLGTDTAEGPAPLEQVEASPEPAVSRPRTGRSRKTRGPVAEPAVEAAVDVAEAPRKPRRKRRPSGEADAIQQ